MVSGYLTSMSLPRVDGLSTDPWVLGRHNYFFFKEKQNKNKTLNVNHNIEKRV